VTIPVSVCVFKTEGKVFSFTIDVLKVAPLSKKFHGAAETHKATILLSPWGAHRFECVAEQGAEENIWISGRK